MRNIIIDPILNKPICKQCKKDPKYKLITPSSIQKKYNISKNLLDKIGLKFITTPGTYFKHIPMRLYYEFQVE